VKVLFFLLMGGGCASMFYGFYRGTSRSGEGGWTWAVYLFAGYAAAFLGVLLAFAPRFFS
jgi:hypothetical protein